ncbi:conserved hypothetical protein, partial [Ricinus communis]
PAGGCAGVAAWAGSRCVAPVIYSMAAATGGRPRGDVPQCAMACTGVRHCVCRAVRDRHPRPCVSVSRLAQSHASAGAARQRARGGNLPRCGAVDPIHPVGSGSIAGIHPPRHSVAHRPAPMRAPHAAFVDEPVRRHHHGYGAGFAGWRARSARHRADRQQHHQPHAVHRAHLLHRARLVLRLLLSDFAPDSAPGACPCRRLNCYPLIRRGRAPRGHRSLRCGMCT